MQLDQLPQIANININYTILNSQCQYNIYLQALQNNYSNGYLNIPNCL